MHGFSRMFKLTLRIRHNDCWASAISAAFPQYQMYLRNTVPVGNRAMDILHVRSTRPDTFSEIQTFLDSHPIVERSEILDRTPTSLSVVVTASSEQSIIRTVSESNGFILKPVQLLDGEEVWTVGLAGKDGAKEMVDRLSSIGQVEVASIVRDGFQALKLTRSQRQSVDLAHAMGYYEFPRKASPAEVAKRMGVSKSTLLEHLHKAESRIIAAYLETA